MAFNKIVLLRLTPLTRHCPCLAGPVIPTFIIHCDMVRYQSWHVMNIVITFTDDKWNESGFRPPLCTYRLNWARRTSWGWWDDWDDTVLQTQEFEPWRSEAEHATSRSRRLPTILTFTRGWGRNIFVSFKPPSPGTEPRALAWKAAVLTTTLGPRPLPMTKNILLWSYKRKYAVLARDWP